MQVAIHMGCINCGINTHFVYVWMAARFVLLCVLHFKCESCALFTGPTNIFFSKIFIKNRSHGTIHLFKNYFTIVFSVFSNKRYPNSPSVSAWMHISPLAFCVLAFQPGFFFFFFNQRLLHCSWDMNSANKQMNSVFGVNSNSEIIFL